MLQNASTGEVPPEIRRAKAGTVRRIVQGWCTWMLGMVFLFGFCGSRNSTPLETGWEAYGERAVRIWKAHPSRLWVGALEAWCAVEVSDGFCRCALRSGGVGPLLYERLPTLRQVTGYFAEALEETPIPHGRNVYVFERMEEFEWGVSCRKARISEEDGWVRVQWCTNDDFGLSELREFFEAPFFMKEETECFYRWLGQGGWWQSVFRGQEVRMGVLATLSGFYVEMRWRVGHGL